MATEKGNTEQVPAEILVLVENLVQAMNKLDYNWDTSLDNEFTPNYDGGDEYPFGGSFDEVTYSANRWLEMLKKQGLPKVS